LRIAMSIKYATLMVLSSTTLCGVFLWTVGELLWTCHSIVYDFSNTDHG